MSEEKTVIDALKEKVRVYKQTVDELERAEKNVEKYKAYRNSVGKLAEKTSCFRRILKHSMLREGCLSILTH